MVERFVISRTFEAPRHRVFAAWTEASQLQQWFGPAGVTMPVCKMDLLPGGLFHYAMALPDGQLMWGKWQFREIVSPGRLVFVATFSDADGGDTRHPFAPEWPLHMLSTIVFTEAAGGTLVTIEWLPLAATDAETATFAAGREGMQQGWAGTLDKFADYLTPQQGAAPMKVNPYIHFDGECRAAFDFYAEALGGKIVMAMTYGESPMPTGCPESHKDHIMHIAMALGGTTIMGSDAPPGMYEGLKGFSISLNLTDPAEAERIYGVLAADGTVRMPLQETFWAHKFAMLTDRFGVPWMVNCEKTP